MRVQPPIGISLKLRTSSTARAESTEHRPRRSAFYHHPSPPRGVERKRLGGRLLEILPRELGSYFVEREQPP